MHFIWLVLLLCSSILITYWTTKARLLPPRFFQNVSQANMANTSDPSLVISTWKTLNCCLRTRFYIIRVFRVLTLALSGFFFWSISLHHFNYWVQEQMLKDWSLDDFSYQWWTVNIHLHVQGLRVGLSSYVLRYIIKVIISKQVTSWFSLWKGQWNLVFGVGF